MEAVKSPHNKFMKVMELSQMRKKMSEDVPECKWQIWQDSKHANLRLPNYTELKLEKAGPLTVSVVPRVAENSCLAIEIPEFTEEVEKATNLVLGSLTYNQLVVVVKTMMELRDIPVKDFLEQE